MSKHYSSSYCQHIIPLEWDEDTVTVLNYGGINIIDINPCTCNEKQDHTEYKYIIHSSKRFDIFMKIFYCCSRATRQKISTNQWKSMVEISENCSTCCLSEDVKTDFFEDDDI
jgi:hypothetical protein